MADGDGLGELRCEKPVFRVSDQRRHKPVCLCAATLPQTVARRWIVIAIQLKKVTDSKSVSLFKIDYDKSRFSHDTAQVQVCCELFIDHL